MLPVAVLPVAGLLLAIGSAKFAILPEVVFHNHGPKWGRNFGNLPLIFAIGTALGLANNDGVAALSCGRRICGDARHYGVFGNFWALK